VQELGDFGLERKCLLGHRGERRSVERKSENSGSRTAREPKSCPIA
jgi:hypothetical protein